MGRKDVVSFLLEHGADINMQGGGYGNALLAASLMGRTEVVSLLIEHRADISTLRVRCGRKLFRRLMAAASGGPQT